MKNHAFIMPIFKSPNLVARIISVLNKENHYFFLHVDKKTKNYNDFVTACRSFNNVSFIKRIPIYHGGISQCYATLSLLEATRVHPVHFDYVHLISGNDYPLRSNEQFDSFFENEERSFMCFNYDKDLPYWKSVYEEHTNWWHSNGSQNTIDQFLNKHSHSRLLNKLFHRRPIENLAGGWDWCTWHNNVVNYILDTLVKGYSIQGLNRHPLLKRFNHTLSPCEHLFTTLLINHINDLKICKHFPLRYVSWEPYREIPSKYRPYNLTEDDYERVINSAAFFCRKVDQITSAKLLDMIDAQRGHRYDITEHDYFL